MAEIPEPFYWVPGTLLVNEAGLIDRDYYGRRWSMKKYQFFTSGLVVSRRMKESPVPSYIFELLTEKGAIYIADQDEISATKLYKNAEISL
tara:strand:- start:152 stop:424 length:273 start_codon:yes stop_codon:yes gene_type:complete